MAKHPVPFSWRALLLTPLFISIPGGFVFIGGAVHPIAAFGVCALLAYLFTFAAIGCLLLPTFWLVSWLTESKIWLSAVIGGLLAAPIFLAWDYMNWTSSGVDSGPPAMTYAQWSAKTWFSLEPLIVISLGVASAVVYHFLATRKKESSR